MVEGGSDGRGKEGREGMEEGGWGACKNLI